MFRNAHAFMAQCDRCQRREKISKGHEMEHKSILEVEVFDCWGIEFMGRSNSFPNERRVCSYQAFQEHCLPKIWNSSRSHK